jgi:hypothetical protein
MERRDTASLPQRFGLFTPGTRRRRHTEVIMAETAQAPIDAPGRLSPVTNAAQGRKIGLRRLDPPSDRAGRIVRLGRLTLAALRPVALGLAVLGSVLVWLVIVPLFDLAVAPLGRLGRLLGVRESR